MATACETMALPLVSLAERPGLVWSRGAADPADAQLMQAETSTLRTLELLQQAKNLAREPGASVLDLLNRTKQCV